MKSPYSFTATCAAGLETLVCQEIASFGGNSIVEKPGNISWSGELESGYRACLYSRFSSRVLLKIADFSIKDEISLYERVKAVSWLDHFELTETFAVNCTLSSEAIVKNNRFAGLKTKDGIVDAFRDLCGDRPNVSGSRPDVQIHVHIEKTCATLFIDFSGESLHRRGYRHSVSKASLKESLGAAIVSLSDWCPRADTLVDPMCGSGTLLIEAALMFGDLAPALQRDYFGFLGWKGHQDKLWQELVIEAWDKKEQAPDKKWPEIIGYDCDPEAVSAARKNVAQAGLSDFIRIYHGELANIESLGNSGTIVSNLPYGERLLEAEVVRYLYRGFGRIVRSRFSGWHVAAFISNPDLADSFSLAWSKKFRLFNGPIQCRLLVGEAGKASENFVWRLPERKHDQEGEEFSNRLRKNLKKMLKWAEKAGIECFRVYDKDIPEFNVSIDVYGKWVHMQEYAPPKNVDLDLSQIRFRLAVKIVKDVFDIRSNRLFLKTRERQKGKNQYRKKDTRKKIYEVEEKKCSFLVNFTDYIDTGLFLDHRPLREKIGMLAQEKSFLNLFGYTGAATIHAAMGGAATTTTVDLSATYLHWVRMNLALNGLGEITNRLEKGDSMEWLRNNRRRFDLILIDPPTFSNTKKEKRVFDVQRDHVSLLQLGMSALNRDGLLLFSTNYRRFKLDESLRELYDIQDMSRESIPFDFSRNQKIHSCWQVKWI